MFYNEHSPHHFHATYGEFNAEISIRELVIISGHLPPRVLGLVIEWAAQHKSELLENWNLAESKQVLNRIEPLL